MKNNRYTQAEETSFCHIYVHTNASRNNRAAIAELLHGSHHSLASYAAMFGRLEALDNRNPKATRFGVSKSLAATAAAFSPERFA